MPTTDESIFQEADVRLAQWAKAVAHPARIAILRTLAERGTCICGEIVEVLPLAQSTVSQHLKALKATGLVQGTVDGPRSCYCVNAGALRQLQQDFERLFTQLSQGGSCC